MSNKNPAVENRSFQTNKNILNMTAQPISMPHKNTKGEEDKVGHVMKRFNKMKDKRGIIDRRWRNYMIQYESLFTPYPDGRSSSNVPLERAIIELAVAELQKRQTQYQIKELVGAETESFLFEKTWKQDWEFYKRGNVMLENEYTTGIFGTSFLFTGFSQTERIVKDYSGVNDEGVFQFDKKLIKEGKILVENLDPRNVWIDDLARNIDNANDCIIEEYIGWPEFQQKKLDPNYKNIDGIVPSFTYNEKGIFTTTEEKGSTDANYVKITKYWNRASDEYLEIANEVVIIREHPIINASHELPIIPRQYGKNLYGIYGYGLCEALQMFKSEINNLREMLMDAVKRSNQETVAIGGGLEFDGVFGYDNQIHQYSGASLSENFRQITGTPPNSAIFSYLERLYQDISIFVGIDIQNILASPQQTAFQTAVQKESSLARINVVIKNRDVAMERFADLHKGNIQKFYHITIKKSSFDIDEAGNVSGENKKPSIILEDKAVENNKIVDRPGKRVLDISNEDIRGDFSLDVFTDLNQPVLNEVEKEQKLQFFQTISEVIQSLSLSPELLEKFPIDKTVDDLARMFNVDTEKSMGNDIQQSVEELDEMRKDVEGIGGGGGIEIPPIETGEEGVGDQQLEQQLQSITTP